APPPPARSGSPARARPASGAPWPSRSDRRQSPSPPSVPRYARQCAGPGRRASHRRGGSSSPRAGLAVRTESRRGGKVVSDRPLPIRYDVPTLSSLAAKYIRRRGPACGLVRPRGHGLPTLPDRSIARAAENHPRQRAGVGCVLDDERAVDENRRTLAARILVRVGIGRPIAKILRIEDRDVGAKTIAQQSAILELEGVCG